MYKETSNNQVYAKTKSKRCAKIAQMEYKHNNGELIIRRVNFIRIFLLHIDKYVF
jgi:hypothetical protein